MQSPPSSEDIKAQLERIATSEEFPGVGRGGAFLRYVVGEVLAGRAKRIKGYSIAIEVFGRKDGFTQDDPVVRIEAGRLRRTLERYYLVAGQSDPLKIDIPKGCYVPTFAWACPQAGDPAFEAPPTVAIKTRMDWRTQGEWIVMVLGVLTIVGAVAFDHWEAVAPAMQVSGLSDNESVQMEPTLVVVPFADLGGGANARTYANGLTEELLTALPRFKEIKVSEGAAADASSSDAGGTNMRQGLGAQYLLAGGVRVSGNRVRVTARLLETRTDSILWSQNYDDDLYTQGQIAAQADVANEVATAVAQPYGIISTAAAARLSPGDAGPYACTLRFYAYRSDLSAERHGPVRDCLESAVARYPTYATAWAMLSITYLDEHRFKYNQRNGEPSALERSLQAARRAVHIDPDNTRGQQALMTALFFNKQPEESLRVGEQALKINPNDTEVISEFGTRLAMSGQWKRGASLLRDALVRNPGGAGHYHGIVALADYMQDDNAHAVAEIRQADQQKFPLFHLVAAIVYAQAGIGDDAKRESASFSKSGPEFLVHLSDEIEERLLRPLDRDRILASLRQAGSRIPDALGVAQASDSTVGQ
jgi:adenylate cyclase